MESSLLCPTVFGDMLLTAKDNALTGLYLPEYFPKAIPPQSRVTGSLRHRGNQADTAADQR